LVGVTLIFFALGLFRAISSAELMPLALSCIYFTNSSERIKKVCIVAVCIIAVVSLDYLITVWLAGGYTMYSIAVKRVMGLAFAQKSIFAGANIKEHAFMFLRLIVWLVFVSLPTIIAAGFANYIWQKEKKSRLKMLIMCLIYL
jgi:hypothetical protein